MKKIHAIIIFFFLCIYIGLSQNIPAISYYNENIIWENVFTEGNPGKVNRGIVDSEGNAAVIFMPDNQSRIHKINGETGSLIWTKSIQNTVGFGISEINDNDRIDYLVCGGSGATQERWMARLNGDNGSIIWNKTYTTGNASMFDGIRTTIVGNDGQIYGAGFVGGDEPDTIFVVYGGSAMVIKVNPSNGNEIWTHINSDTEYAMAIIETPSGNLFYGSTNYDENLTLTKIETNGSEIWTRNLSNTQTVIPADLDISTTNNIYYGGHTPRPGDGEPFDYTLIKIDLEANVDWVKHYAGPRGYNLDYIRNELYGLKVIENGVYLFGGTGDEDDDFSQDSSIFESSDVWNGWVVTTDLEGNILRSDVFCHQGVNTATEYGDITEDGYMIFNDTDAFGDTEVGVMRILDTALSTSQNQLSGSLEIYPNPSSERITVSGLKVIQMKIYNNLGQLMLEADNTNVLNVSSLSAGVYFIKITDGINFSIKKFIRK